MFQDRLKPCAAGDRCTLKPMLADPHHKCPTCEQHIHAIFGVPNINAHKLCHGRIWHDCFTKIGASPKFAPVSQNITANSCSTQSQPSRSSTSSTNTSYSTSPTSSANTSSSTMAQIYFYSISQLDGSPDTSSIFLFSMATWISEEEILKESYDDLVKNKN